MASESGDAAARPIRARATEMHGSNAGAGSGALAQYMKHRRVEMERLEGIEKQLEREQKNAAVQKQREHNAEVESARTEKNRRKRQRRKGHAKGNETEDGENDAELSPEEAKELLRLAEEEAAAATSTTNHIQGASENKETV